ncbi:MAG: hypothetical protein BGO72_15465 [Burkholderiales bacterium 70-64]|nr:MAG: hypothetical protein BGO72_15465 [Burkholderiales bacterium 70-64]
MLPEPTMLRKLLGLSRTEPIDAERWRRITAGLPFLGHLDRAQSERLKTQCEAFLAGKQFSGAAGFEVDDDVRVAIAIQACLPTLELHLRSHLDFVEIVVYPDRFIVPRRQTDEAGVVHESDDELAGEAMHGGPVVLSWPDADPASARIGFNVVIHEFAHKLDLLDGEADGAPPMPAALRDRWARTMGSAYDDFCRRLERVEASIPRHIDPESSAADRWYERLPLDPYAATDPGEFFAVVTEAFFTDPVTLHEAYPALYELLREYFRQDPSKAASTNRFSE